MWRPSDTYSAQLFAKIISGDNRERSVFIIGCNQFFTYGAIVREAVNGCQINYACERTLLQRDGRIPVYFVLSEQFLDIRRRDCVAGSDCELDRSP